MPDVLVLTVYKPATRIFKQIVTPVWISVLWKQYIYSKLTLPFPFSLEVSYHYDTLTTSKNIYTSLKWNLQGAQTEAVSLRVTTFTRMTPV